MVKTKSFVKKFAYSAPVAALLALPLAGFAQQGNFEGPPIQPTETITSIGGLFNTLVNITNWLLVFALVIGVIMIIVGGVMYITAGGSTDKAKTASKLIAYAAIGIAVVALAWGIVKVVASLVGAQDSVSGFGPEGFTQ